MLKAIEIARYLKEISGPFDELFTDVFGNKQVSIYNTCGFLRKAKKAMPKLFRHG